MYPPVVNFHLKVNTNDKCLSSHLLSVCSLLFFLLCRNEREGIPVQLIQLLDECVEIPQLGIIRSLNVHVSGAILVWEYTKQHMQPC